MKNDLIPEREESLFMGMLVLVDMTGRYCQGIVTFSFNLISGDGLIVLPDVDHQHVYMQQLFLLHTITIPKLSFFCGILYLSGEIYKGKNAARRIAVQPHHGRRNGRVLDGFKKTGSGWRTTEYEQDRGKVRINKASRENDYQAAGQRNRREPSMLIGVMSDTHDNILQAQQAVSFFNNEGVEQVLHAGDYIAPFMIDTLKDLEAPLAGVFGNNDGDRVLLEQKAAAFPRLTIAGVFARLDAGGIRIALLHGHDRQLLQMLLSSRDLDLLVYGHTHLADIRRNGSLLIVNPGEVYGHLSGRSTVALVDTEKRAGRIVEI